MPVHLHETIPGGEIVIWQTTESYDTLASGVTAAEVASAARFANDVRRTEHLAARAALRIIFPGAVVEYDENGAPVLVNDNKFTGLSHCKGAAAAIVSDLPCAIDIEPIDRNFTRASSKFITPRERTLPGAGHPLFEGAVWCAKEALYKYARTGGLDFLRDLEILSGTMEGIDTGAGTEFSARIKEISTRVRVRTAGRYIFAFVCGEQK